MTRYSYETVRKGLWGKLEPEARRMRGAPTEAERALWERLRGQKLGVRFRRQHAIDRFVVDFACLPAKLIVEVDGTIHDEQQAQDRDRDARLRAEGWQVVRYSNEAVLEGIEEVLIDIRRRVSERMKNPSPLERGRPRSGRG